MDIKVDIYLNQLAQGVKPINDAIKWFSELPEDIQPEILKRVVFFILQAGTIGKDVEKAIYLSGLKPTYTACQLLLKTLNEEPNGNNMLKVILAKITNLPKSERCKSFRLLIALFVVANEKKLKKELNPEKHWWHQDLSNEEVIKEILGSVNKSEDSLGQEPNSNS